MYLETFGRWVPLKLILTYTYGKEHCQIRFHRWLKNILIALNRPDEFSVIDLML